MYNRNKNIKENKRRARASLKIGEFPVRARFRKLLQTSDRQNIASFYIHVLSNVAADLLRQIYKKKKDRKTRLNKK